MSDFGNEFIYTSTREVPNHLDFEKKLGLQPLTSKRAKEIMGITSSTHEVDIVETKQGGFVLRKTYATKDKDSLSQNEVAIITSLPESTTVQFPTLYAPNIYRNTENNPVILVNFEQNYVPLSAFKKVIQSELLSGKTDMVNQLITAVHEMHKLGIFHNDLHDNNIGIIPPKGVETANRVMIIDFDLSRKNEYVEPEDMISDLLRVSFHMLKNISADDYLIAEDNLVQIINRVYGDEININALKDQLTSSIMV